jgi:hypothetical protein
LLSESGFKLGVKGKLNITASSLSTELEGAVFVYGDTSTTLTGSKRIMLYQKDLAKYEGESIPIFGLIKLRVKPILKVEIPLTISSSCNVERQMRYAYTGIYGAGFYTDASWGVSVSWRKVWWKIYRPVFSFYCDGKSGTSKVQKTAYLAAMESTPDTLSLAGASVSIYPSVSYGLGADILMGFVDVAGGSITVGMGIDGSVSIHRENTSTLVGIGAIDFVAGVNMEAHVGFDIPIIHYPLKFSWPYSIVSAREPIARWELFRVNL